MTSSVKKEWDSGGDSGGLGLSHATPWPGYITGKPKVKGKPTLPFVPLPRAAPAACYCPCVCYCDDVRGGKGKPVEIGNRSNGLTVQ